MPRPDPTEFCSRYLEIMARATWSDFESSKGWTKLATQAAQEVCGYFGLKTNREYLRLDTAGWERTLADQPHDWVLRVAFEHEQKRHDWHDEFCKLAHVVADLRVLAFYHRFDRDGEIQQILQDRAILLQDRIRRAVDCQWLFIVGPYRETCDQEFMAFTMGTDCVVLPVNGVRSFCPRQLIGFQNPQ